MSALPAWIGNDEADDDFVASLRRGANEALAAHGLPNRKTESFRFTSVRDLLETDFARASGDADSALVQRRLGPDETYRVVVGNGAPMMTGATRDGVNVCSLDRALTDCRDAVHRVLGRLVPNEFFSAANTASFDDAVVIVIPTGVVAEVPIHLVHTISAASKDAVANPRVLVLAEPNSRVTLVESYLGDTSGRSFVNAVVELDLGAGAVVEHVISVESAGRTVSAIGVSLADDARYRCRSALLGGKLTRFDHHVAPRGARTSVDLAGVVFARGEDIVDHHVRIDHRGPNGSSRQRFRGLADERGTSVFDGIVAVHAGAPGCEVAQESKNLLLSADATVHAKPHLEIEVDEVVASHGTTVGSLDPEQLFYLRARGIGEDDARALLTNAFVRAVLDDVPVDSAKSRMLANVVRLLPRGEMDLSDEEVPS